MHISIVIPIYKGQKHINRIVEMLGKMDGISAYDKLEIVFVNDHPGFKLDTYEINDCSCLSISIIENKKNIGIHASRIKGLNKAKGEYIVFLDQDDTLDQSYFSSQLNHLKENKAVICNGLWRNGEKIFSESNPMKYSYDFNAYLKNGYPLVSLGQLLIKKDMIPTEWLAYPMKENGWDDHFLWALLMVYKAGISVNESIIYIHEEDGNNLSFDWKKMSQSGENFRQTFILLNKMNLQQKYLFEKLVNKKINKYYEYQKLEEQIKLVTIEKIEKYMRKKNIHKIAIYGMGIYGKELLNILRSTSVSVEYGIDKRCDVKDVTIDVFKLSHKISNVDVIIVTPISDFSEIRNEIHKYCDYNVISLTDFLRDGMD